MGRATRKQAEYDFVSVLEAPDEETAFEFGLNISKIGDVRTKTQRKP